MPAGKVQINTLVDSATDPDDTEVLAAPGAGFTNWIQWLYIIIITPQASSQVNVEDGAGGDVLAGRPASGALTQDFRYVYNDTDWGLPQTANTALNVEVSGATGVVARIVGEVIVRGG